MLGEAWFPPRSKMVCHFKDGEHQGRLLVEVDRRFPRRWCEEPYRSELCNISLHGLERSPHFLTEVWVGSKFFLVLGDHEVEDPGPGVAVKVGPHAFRWITVESKEEIPKLMAAMERMQAELQAMPEEHRMQLAVSFAADKNR
jgi:hypothetical protein